VLAPQSGKAEKVSLTQGVVVGNNLTLEDVGGGGSPAWKNTSQTIRTW